MKKISQGIILIVMASFACSEDHVLSQSIFVEDKLNQGLPAYSENGYNTFGAYYDRAPFISGQKIPLKVIAEKEETSFTFIGMIGYSEEVSITFKTPDFHPGD